MPVLDDFDHRLLALLQENSRLTGKELGERVGLSAAACLRRVQRLRDTGVIEKDVAVVSPDIFGRKLTMIVLVTVSSKDRLFAEAMRKAPEVVNCHHVTGSADMVLTVQTENMDAYNDFVEAHFYEPYIERYESFGVLSTVK